jgi:hypothetical protein
MPRLCSDALQPVLAVVNIPSNPTQCVFMFVLDWDAPQLASMKVLRHQPGCFARDSGNLPQLEPFSTFQRFAW